MAYYVQPQLGELRHRLNIEAITSETSNPFNEKFPVYESVGTRYAKITADKSESLSLAQAMTRTNLSHYTITMRYFPGLNDNHRLRLGTGGLSTMTAAELAALTASQFATLTAASVKPIYYKISSINDPDIRRRWHVVDVVEVTA